MCTHDVSKIPAQWHDFLGRALSAWNATAFSVRGTLGGQSGSEVILVEIRTIKHDGLGILKLSEQDQDNNEASRQEEARSLAPALSVRIPDIIHQFAEDIRSAFMMTVAGGGLLEAQVMATASGGGAAKFGKPDYFLFLAVGMEPKARIRWQTGGSGHPSSRMVGSQDWTSGTGTGRPRRGSSCPPRLLGFPVRRRRLSKSIRFRDPNFPWESDRSFRSAWACTRRFAQWQCTDQRSEAN